MKRQQIFEYEELKKFAVQLKKKRKEKGYSQEELAYKSEIALSQIARIETAKINTTLSTVFKIAKTLEIETKELFDFDS
jgi:predicted transcriptional regulator